MSKRMKEVDRVIAEIDAEIEALTASRNRIIAARVKVTHAPKATRKPRAVAPKDAA